MTYLFFVIPLVLLFFIAFIIDFRAKKSGNKIDFNEKSHHEKDPYRQAEAENIKALSQNGINSSFRN